MQEWHIDGNGWIEDNAENRIVCSDQDKARLLCDLLNLLCKDGTKIDVYHCNANW